MPSKESAISRCKGSSDWGGREGVLVRKKKERRPWWSAHLNIRMSVGEDLRPLSRVNNEDSELSNDVTNTSLEIRVGFIVQCTDQTSF
jgi:hypothetical protein